MTLTFGHKLYGYVEDKFDKVLSAQAISASVNSLTSTGSKHKNHHVEQSLYANSPEQQKQQSYKLEKVTENNCPRPLLITTTQEAPKKYYYLNTNLGNSFEAFLSDLDIKLTAAFQHIENQLAITLNSAITLNLVFKTTRANYENYVLKLGISPQGSQGVYISPNNLSIVELKSHEQGIKTAVHEAIHAFNQAYWGNSLRFFNEGMAEYLESITANGLIPPFDFSWLTHQQYPKQISTLLFSEVDWHGNNRHELYQNSKALFHFLMSHESGRKVVLKIMKLEMEDPCTTLEKESIETLLFDVFPNHQQEFDYWFSNGLNSFINSKTDVSQ